MPGRQPRRSKAKAGALPFWKRKTLSQLTASEWEKLCDGCGKCCLHKLEYIDTGEIEFTNVACKLLDSETCRCTSYADRKQHVPDCVKLTPRRVGQLAWLPPTCAYRLVGEGKDLYWWHPLVSGDPQSVHEAGMSVRGKVIAEEDAGPLEQHVISSDL